jgi:hypothetical protein
MPYFDRFDICAAYYQLEMDYNVSGILRERPSCRRRNASRGESIAVQLNRLGFRPGYGGNAMTENAQEIYNAAAQRFGLTK